MSRRKSTVLKMIFFKKTKKNKSLHQSLTCVHLIHTVQEVIWSARNAVTAHAQAAVCALVPGVVGPTENQVQGGQGCKPHRNAKEKWTSSCSNVVILMCPKQSRADEWDMSGTKRRREDI